MTSTYHIGLLVLRLAFSGMLLTHGILKLMNLLQGNMDFIDPLGIGTTLTFILAVFAEAICPLFIIIGYKARIAAIPPIISMAVAAFVVHSGEPFGKKELALLYLFAFLVIALTGAGRFSADKK